MHGRFGALVWRRRYVIAGAVFVAMGLVTTVAYLSPKAWQATATVQLDPLQVAGLHSAGPAVPTAEAAIAGDVAAARGRAFREGVTASSFPFNYSVEGDIGTSTIRFVARSDSADRAYVSAYSVANGYLAWGRVQQAIARAEDLRGQIATLEASAGTSPPPTDESVSVADLREQLRSAESAVHAMEQGAGTVTVPPEIPEEPASPDLRNRLLVAAGFGLAIGLALAFVVDRRSASAAAPGPEPPPREPRTLGQRLARSALGGVAVLAPLLLVASVIAGLVSVWQLRPSTNALAETNLRCLAQWLEPIPDGTSVEITSDSDGYFLRHFREFAFPRLTMPDREHPWTVSIHPVPGPGPEACGDFHLEVERR